MQVDPNKPKLKAPGTKRLKLRCDGPLSNVAFNFNLRRYIKGLILESYQTGHMIAVIPFIAKVGRCRLNP